MQCRICLLIGADLRSVFETHNDISYATMITSVAAVKIDENGNNMICFVCIENLKYLYEFKNLIERSDYQLNHKIKRLRFNNIHDIIISASQDGVTMLQNHLDDKIKDVKANDLEDNTDDTKQPDTKCYLNKLNGAAYIDLVIKKTKDNHVEFSETLQEVNNRIPHGENPTTFKLKQRKTKSMHKGKRRLNLTLGIPQIRNNVCITPVYLEDIRIISTRKINHTFKEKDLKTKRNKRKKHVCPYCGKLVQLVKKHVLIHTAERKFKCTICDHRYYEEKELSRHMKSHMSLSVFKCDHCIASFREKAALVRHMVKHQHSKKYTCDTCNKSFKWLSGLNRHTLTHRGKSVICEVCQMTFLCKYHLRNHMRVHTKERPYNCEICCQPYSYKRDFNKHCFKKHGVFLKRRSVNVMNAEVLEREKAIMEELILHVQNFLKEGQPLSSALNPFTGPQAAQAFESAVKQLQENNMIPLHCLN